MESLFLSTDIDIARNKTSISLHKIYMVSYYCYCNVTEIFSLFILAFLIFFFYLTLFFLCYYNHCFLAINICEEVDNLIC